MINRNELEDLKRVTKENFNAHPSDYWKGYLKAIEYIMST